MRTALLAVAIAVATVESSSAFEYRIPDGWIDLVKNERVYGYPKAVMDQAWSGRYRIYAVDPDHVTDRGADLLMNVVESPGAVAMTRRVLDSMATSTMDALEKHGFSTQLSQSELLAIDGVPIGYVSYSVVSTYSLPAVSLRQEQYLIPGKSGMAVLTFACRPDLCAQAVPLFRQTALATRGAFRNQTPWEKALPFTIFGASIPLILLVILRLIDRKKSSPAPKPQRVWECASCRRRVPVRLEQCRCGTARPAE